MSYSSEVSQTFSTVISFHFTVAACLPLYTCVSLNPCTSNSCHVLLTVLSQDTLSSGRADSPDILLQTQNSEPHPSARAPVLSPFSCCTSHLAAPECTYPHYGQCLFPLSAQRSSEQGGERASHSDFSPDLACSAGRCISRLQGPPTWRGTLRISQLQARLQLEFAINFRMLSCGEQGFVRSRIVLYSYC